MSKRSYKNALKFTILLCESCQLKTDFSGSETSTDLAALSSGDLLGFQQTILDFLLLTCRCTFFFVR